MSRVGKEPIIIPEEVKVEVKKSEVKVTGPLGSISQTIPEKIKVKKEEGKIKVLRKDNSRSVRSLHGLIRTLVWNMILGVTKGWQKILEIRGTGYRAKLEDGKLVLSLGFSHPVVIDPVEGIEFKIKDKRKIIVSGVNKALVGSVAAKIRKTRPPDSYKGKGVRYQGETVKLKPGKAGKLGLAGPGLGEV